MMMQRINKMICKKLWQLPDMYFEFYCIVSQNRIAISAMVMKVLVVMVLKVVIVVGEVVSGEASSWI